MRISTIAPIILALAVWPVSAEVYKWKTESGEIQYGQFPPAGVKAERMTAGGLQAVPGVETAVDTDTGAAAGSPQQRLKMLEEQQAEQASAATEQANEAQQAALRKKNCTTARSNLAILQQGGHQRMKLPDGTVAYLTEEETAQRIAQTEKDIETNCD